ncbi:MAG TPA: PucR family transcriptional regulator ligand-binding domain-containing protein [Solirubrobacteraceae bacterium]|nr:PucR family transcriptional regulator ligand-binding domain-containing protein [Solirubrobacteraceae bacterium]
MVTVRDLLGELDGLRLLAGQDAIDVPVRWVHITELKDPTPWLSGGELLLTTGMQLGTAQRQREFVERLASHRLAGLGFGTGFGHREVPAALLEAARECDFPVFEVPYETPFIAVTEAAFTRLVNEQYAVLRRALAAHERLERVVLSEQGLEALAGTLATLLGAAILICDARGRVLASHAFRRTLEPETVRALREELAQRRGGTGPQSARRARAFLPAHAELADRALALPVAVEPGAPGGGAPAAGAGFAGGASPSPAVRGGGASEPMAQGWLVAIKDSGPLSDFDRLTLHQAVTIVALELLRERVAGDTERRLAGDLLSAIVSGELAGPELARRLAPFGLGQTLAAIVVRHDEGRPVRRAPQEAETALAQTLREDASPGLVATVSLAADGPALTCALVPGAEESELLALARSVAARLPSGAQPRVGLGRAVSAERARRSFHEARCAIEAMWLTHPEEVAHAGGNGAAHTNGNGNGQGSTRAAPPGGRVATYQDLGSFQLLLSLQDEEALRLFCDSILGPIEAGDGQYGGELMRSLEAFIEENGQWERAARRLYCHRHTLRYRIRRVEELTGRSLSSARDRIEFWLALRGREITT